VSVIGRCNSAAEGIAVVPMGGASNVRRFLIRCLGAARVEQVVEAQGELGSFRSFLRARQALVGAQRRGGSTGQPRRAGTTGSLSGQYWYRGRAWRRRRRRPIRELSRVRMATFSLLA
jgi:hypothetical protein